MSRKGSFDFHMLVIAKETTSSAFTCSACLCFWLPHKLHFGAVLRNQQGWGVFEKLYSTWTYWQDKRCPFFSEVLGVSLDGASQT